MSLTPEERARIYEEEKARIEAEKLRPPVITKTDPPPIVGMSRSGKQFFGTLIVLALATFVVVMVGRILDNGNSPKGPDAAVAARDPFNDMTPAQHLKAGQLPANSNENHVESALRNLGAISKDQQEYPEAQRLLKKANARKVELAKIRTEAGRLADIEKNPLVVVKSVWAKGGFDTVAEWRVTFKNRSKKPVGNIKYKTEYVAETGKRVDQGGVASLLGDSKTILKVIPPGATRTLEINDGFLHPEAYRASFDIVGWEYVQDTR